MTDDDRDQTGSTEQPKKPTALLLECWRGETRQAQVFWVDADHIVPEGTSVVLELQPGEGLLQAAKRIADGLQFPQTAEQWRSLGLLPEALPTLRQALLEAIEAAERGAPHKVTGDLVSRLVIVAHEEEPSKPKRDKPARRQRIPVRDEMQIGSGFGEQAIHRICFHSHLLQTGPDNPYPRATFRLGRQEVTVELSPPEAEGTLLLPEQEALLATKMGQMAQRIGGMDAALFCILQDLWIQKASHPDERVLCNVDYLLEARGIKPRRNSDDRSGGYRP